MIYWSSLKMWSQASASALQTVLISDKNLSYTCRYREELLLFRGSSPSPLTHTGPRPLSSLALLASEKSSPWNRQPEHFLEKEQKVEFI